LNILNLSGCELIDTENISLPRQNMKLGGEWAKHQSYSHSDDMFIILKSNIKTDTSTFVYLYFRRTNHMIQNIQNTRPQNIVHKHRHYTTAHAKTLFVHTFSIQAYEIHSLFKDICHQTLIYTLYIIIYTWVSNISFLCINYLLAWWQK
jgi:hypothetical protein